jgi:pimeloyl-ACP methyl ester carboxylesterase
MRQVWHEAGYISHLQSDFTVVTVDLRGHGESGMPTDPAEYTSEKMSQDILAVADACSVKRFIIWAMSYGTKICRYLSVHSERVTKLIMMEAQLGLGASDQLRQDAVDFCAHWPPILQAQRDGTLDLESLSQSDQDMIKSFNVPLVLPWVRALLDWPSIEPADFRCPTLWLAGSEDQHAIASIKEREESLKGSLVQVHIIEGLDHSQVFDEIDRVFPTMLTSSRS